ncbi:MAG: helix-turn-helix transcriptional regulator, partial [Vagococcus sp.]
MYNEIIKKIRIEKGMKQKEVYLNVVSKSFYSDFEAGKNSIEVSKFMGLLSNLGISFNEFEYYQKENEINLEEKIDKLYNQGQFEELYSFYLENHENKQVTLRYLAMKSYLLVLITNTNFYKFSREPFREIISEVENYKTWTLKEISLAK